MVLDGDGADAGRSTGPSAPPPWPSSRRIWAEAPNAPAQYFLDWVDGQTRRVVGAPRQDITVETTLDKPMELDAGRTAAAVVARHSAQRIEQAAVISVDGQGHVRAFVGGVDYQTSPFDRAVDAHRQAGSSWKPFVYLAALEAGRTPDTVVGDEPVQIGDWSPRDFEEGYLGPITLQQALAKSINTVAARLADEVGRDVVAADAHRLGIVSQINTDPAMALGTTLVTPLEMAQAYAALSNGGYRVQAYGIERIRTNAGQVLYQHRPAGQPQVAANPPLSELVGMMRTVVTEGTGTRAAVPGYDIAGKTGHHLRLPRRLVLRLHRQLHHRGLDGPRRRCAHAWRHRRLGAGRALARLYARGAAPRRRPGDPARTARAAAADPGLHGHDPAADRRGTGGAAVAASVGHRADIRLDPRAPGLDREQPLAGPVGQHPVPVAQARGHQVVQHLVQRHGRAMGVQHRPRPAQRRLGDGLVIAAGVGVRRVGGLVVGSDDARHARGQVKVWPAPHQP